MQKLIALVALSLACAYGQYCGGSPNVLPCSGPVCGGYVYPCASGDAFTYYVDPTGSDSNPGTLAQPWATVAKVNATALTPGQSVGFKRGGTWREQLTPASSGTAGNPITFGAYGSGAQPSIAAADTLGGWSAYGSSDGYVTLAGATTTWVSTPATAANRLTGLAQFRLQVDVSLTNYASVSTQVLMAKQLASGGASSQWWTYFVNSGNLVLEMYEGSVFVAKRFSVAASLTNGTRYRLRADVTTNNGSGGSSVTFYKSTDGVNFTQIGAMQTLASTITINTSNATAVAIGRNSDAFNAATGTIYRASAWSGFGTSVIFDANLNDNSSGTASWASTTSGETWTINGSPTVVAPVQASGTVWQAPLTAKPSLVLFSGVRGIEQASIAALTGANQWYWSGSVLYVYSATTPTGVEYSSRQIGVYVTKDYITVRDLRVYGTNGVNALGVFTTGANTSILNNTIEHSANYCVNTTGNDTLVAGNTITDCSNGLTYPSGVGAGVKISSLRAVVRGNTISNSYWGVFDQNASDPIIAYNVVSNSIVNCIDHESGIAGHPAIIANNTIIHSPASGTAGHAIAAQVSGDYVRIWNNLIYLTFTGTNPGNVNGLAIEASAYTDVAIDNNLVFKAPGSTADAYKVNATLAQTLSAWQAAIAGTNWTGKDAHSINADPLFTNAAAGDFTLQSGSPAIGAGVFIPGVSTSPTPNIGSK